VYISHFQEVRKVSAVVLKLCKTNLIFTECAAKINRQYYQETLLMKELLRVICSTAGEAFLCLPARQCTKTSHKLMSYDTVKLLCHEAPHSLIAMWPANIIDLNPLDSHILSYCLSEIQAAIPHNNQLFSKPSTFSGKH